MSLESKIDDLYRAPLEEFISSRTALAKTRSGPDAQRVRKLAKPTIAPWAVNQVYWRARAVYDRVLETGERLRRAQVAALEGRKADLRGASDAHREALADAVRQAEGFAVGAGSNPPQDVLMRTFEALSLSSTHPEAPGRLTRALQPAGFEALAGLAINPAAVEARTEARAKVSAAEKKKEEAARKKEDAEQKKQEAAVKKAEAAVERARRRMLEAQAALKRTRDQTS